MEKWRPSNAYEIIPVLPTRPPAGGASPNGIAIRLYSREQKRSPSGIFVTRITGRAWLRSFMKPTGHRISRDLPAGCVRTGLLSER